MIDSNDNSRLLEDSKPSAMGTILLDGAAYGIWECVGVKLTVNDIELIEKQITEKYGLQRCDTCDKLHKSVEAILVRRGTEYNEGRNKTPAEYVYKCQECNKHKGEKRCQKRKKKMMLLQ